MCVQCVCEWVSVCCFSFSPLLLISPSYFCLRWHLGPLFFCWTLEHMKKKKTDCHPTFVLGGQMQPVKLVLSSPFSEPRANHTPAHRHVIGKYFNAILLCFPCNRSQASDAPKFCEKLKLSWRQERRRASGASCTLRFGPYGPPPGSFTNSQLWMYNAAAFSKENLKKPDKHTSLAV